MKKSILFTGVCTIFWTNAVFAQDRAPQQDAADDEIIVTATLRSENLQEVPIAVSAFGGESLDRAGVRDLKQLNAVSASFSVSTTTSESAGSSMRVRGVGTVANNPGFEGSVGIFLDGLYLSRPGIALGDLVDVEQIELLRGPQGTLFGRNTSAGAVHIKTKRPTLNRSEGFVLATYGNYDLMNIQAGVNIPLIEDKAAVRLSGAWRDRDGFTRNVNGDDSYSRNRYILRGQLYFEPTPDVSLRIIADYAKSKERCCDGIIIRDTAYAGAGLYAVSGLAPDGGAPADRTGYDALDKLITANGSAALDRTRQWGVSAELEWTLGDATLTSITGYRDFRGEPVAESDYVDALVYSSSAPASTSRPDSIPAFNQARTFSQEIRVAGSAFEGKLDYLVGVYYSDERLRDRQTFTFGRDHQAYISAALTSVGVPGPNPARNIFSGGVSSQGDFATNLFSQTNRNWSLFSNETIHFSDRLSLNLGLRYSHDAKDASFDQLAAQSLACRALNARAASLPASLAPLVPVARALTCTSQTTEVGIYPGAPVEFNARLRHGELSYTAKLAYKLADEVNTYLSYSRGYKAGGVNLDASAAIGGADPRFSAELVDAYEFGVKARFLDRALTANLALFHQEMTDFQLLEFTGTQFRTFNVPRALSSGVELEMVARVSPELTANWSVSYNDARFPADCAGANPAAQVAPYCGQKLPNAPEWVIITGLDYNRDIGNSLNFGFNGSVRLESDRRTSTAALMNVAAGTGTMGATLNQIVVPASIQDGNAKVNLRASIGAQNDAWKLEFWGNNIFNIKTIGMSANTPLRGIGTLPGPYNAGGIGLSRFAYPQEPRTYGVTARFQF